MQYAIDTVGLPKVLWASFASAVTKLFGKKGVFYKIVGQEVSGLDGFYDHVWKEYGDIGIQMPDNPSGVCDEIKEKLGISMMIVDANDLGQEILGKSSDITFSDEELKVIKQDEWDNAAAKEAYDNKRYAELNNYVLTLEDSYRAGLINYLEYENKRKEKENAYRKL